MNRALLSLQLSGTIPSSLGQMTHINRMWVTEIPQFAVVVLVLTLFRAATGLWQAY